MIEEDKITNEVYTYIKKAMYISYMFYFLYI